MSFPRRSRAAHQRLLGLLLVAAMVLYALPLWWGLPATGKKGKTWVFDEITADNPGSTARMRHRGRYPPLHYSLLRGLQAPVRALAESGSVDVDAEELRAWLQALGRMLSVLMATASVYWVYRAGRLLFDRNSALFGAATWAFVTPLAFFAKTVNLDVPYVFWYALSILFFLRILRRHRLADYLAFAVSGMLAITTKDQAAALYLLPALALVVDLAGHLESPSGRLARLGRALVDRRLVLGLIVAAGVFVAVHDLLFDWKGFLQHVRMITGAGSDPPNAFEATAGGQLQLAVLAVRQLAASMSWPLLLLAVAGVVIAARRRVENRALLLLALFPISYYACFIAVVQYHRMRYFLPVCLVLALFAARGSSFAWNAVPRRRWAVAALLAMLAWAGAQSLSLDLLMQFDTRYSVERWAREREVAGERVQMVSDFRQLVPRSDAPTVAISRLLGRRGRSLAPIDAGYLVLNEAEFLSPKARRFLKHPQSAGSNYVRSRRFRRSPWIDLLRIDGLPTNLVVVSPELTVWRRIELGLSVKELEDRAAALRTGGKASDWAALLDEIVDSRSLAARGVGFRTEGYGLGQHGTTQGRRSAALVFSGPGAATVYPLLTLRCVWDLTDCPAAVEVVTAAKGRQRVELDRDELVEVDLEPVAAGTDRLILVTALEDGADPLAPLGPVRIRVVDTRR